MINVKEYINKALKETGYKVYFFYPESFTTLPIISYYELDNSTRFKEDGEDVLAKITYAIDIWNKTSTSEIVEAVDKKMMAMGFTRTSCVDLYEIDTKIHHKSLKYSGIINKRLFIF